MDHISTIVARLEKKMLPTSAAPLASDRPGQSKPATTKKVCSLSHTHRHTLTLTLTLTPTHTLLTLTVLGPPWPATTKKVREAI